jgi:hypothetical protein
MGPLKELHPKHRLIIEYCVNGAPPHIAKLVTRTWKDGDLVEHSRELRPYEPMQLEEAARALFIRIRHARHLFSQPVFQKEYNKALDALRNGAKVGALQKAIELVHDAGEGKAADRKVQLQAAQFILGEPGSDQPKSGVTVNVGVQLSPGLVIRLPQQAPQTPLDLQANHDDDEGDQ